MTERPPDIWLKAAVAGGIWATMEITLGSLLHNLHIPFSGTFMAMLSVILMTSFVQLWNLRGLIWRAGLICALMKSLSPSAVILGPMTGIMAEALIMEAVLLLAGRRLPGFILAGTGALLSAILHKLVNLFILYGTDLVTIYINLFDFLKKHLNLKEASAGNMVTAILVAYMVLGAGAALAGYFLGRRALRRRIPADRPELGPDPFRADWQMTDPGQSFHLLLLAFHVLAIPFLLYLINRNGLNAAVGIISAVYLLFLWRLYPRILGRLRKPVFWSQLILMTLFAALFWDPSLAWTERLKGGAWVGLEMSLRAVILVSAFSAIAVEIRNPQITNRFLRSGYAHVHSAISLAFNSLPVMLDRSAGLRAFFRRPVSSLAMMISEAEAWLRYYQTR